MLVSFKYKLRNGLLKINILKLISIFNSKT